MADPRFAQFASSEPTGPDAAFWNQKVYFDGVPRRRREIVPTLAATPYMTEKAARLLLTTAPVADGQPVARPPAAWFTTGVIPTPGGAHLEEDEEDDLGDDDDLDEEDDEDEFLDDEDMDDLEDEDEAPSNNHLPIIG